MNNTQLLSILQVSNKPLLASDIIMLIQLSTKNIIKTKVETFYDMINRLCAKGYAKREIDYSTKYQCFRYSITEKGIELLSEQDDLELMKKLVKSLT
jgi:DNA-binding PadR family transcriptional regulator